jgi:hypothetical protein
MTGRPVPRRLPSGKTERKATGGKGDTEAKARKSAEHAVMDADRITCCNQCKQPLIEMILYRTVRCQLLPLCASSVRAHFTWVPGIWPQPDTGH